MPTKERLEHLNDVADDKKGWRRRGDFKSDAEWQAGVNAKPDTATTRRTYSDQAASAALARSSSPPPARSSAPSGPASTLDAALAGRAAASRPFTSAEQLPPVGAPLPSNVVGVAVPGGTPPAVSATETTPAPAPAIVPDWHEGGGHDDDGQGGGNH